MSNSDHEHLSEQQQLDASSCVEALEAAGCSTELIYQVKQSLPAVWSGSLYVEQRCVLNKNLLVGLVQSGELFRAYASMELSRSIRTQLADTTDETTLMQRLRLCRQREMVRIIWRDLAGWATLVETMRELSELADACVDGALSLLYIWTCDTFGAPVDAHGQSQQLVVLGMGKLGGHELNLSSDIDLIFAYPEEGDTQGSKSISNHEFFQKLGQRLVQVMTKLTPDGFVFRVDMRLRPFGNGPLAMSFDSMEHYYQLHGREWERYAMIKARVIAGDLQQGEKLLARLKPFIYRRYVDYSAFESIREMKALIQKEVQLKNKENNVKVGLGGIREIEFIGQVFQLIRGGRESRLQSRSILHVLQTLQAMNILPAYVVRQLNEAYDFLRRTEHRIQAWRDEQTHNLPNDEKGQLRLARSMGFSDWPSFVRQLEQHRTRVHEHFEQVFVAPQADTPSDDAQHLAPLWMSPMEDDEAIAQLQAAGFEQADEIWRHISLLKKSRAYRSLSSRGNERMDRLMPMFLSACQASEQPALSYLRAMQVIEAVMQRSVYLMLLIENPVALSQFIRLCASSPWITRYLAQHPLLLDELLDVNSLLNPPGQTVLAEELARRMQEVMDDEERSMDVLRQFKHSHFLKVAAADIFEALPLMEVSNHLSAIAEVVLEQTLDLAWRHLVAKHGRPVCTHDGQVCDSGFAVIAYGKLGGLELGYGSDLDLVFIHSGESEGLETTGAKPVALGVFFARLGQRMMHILGAMTSAGVLFEVDTRLRPDGAAGMLVSSLAAFTAYQQDKAWTWEHQALVRARPVAGDPAIAEQFALIRRAVLGQQRDPDTLRQAVVEMRDKMLANRETTSRQPGEGEFDLKHSPGGIVDIEFMVQYGVLAYSHQYPELMDWTDNVRILETLARTGVMTPSDAAFLHDAYIAYRNRLHRLKLQEAPAIVAAADFSELAKGVRDIWSNWLAGTSPN